MSTATTTAPAPRPATATPGHGGTLTGVGTLIRLQLRRDRVRLPVWLVSLTVFSTGTAFSFPDLYPTEADRRAVAATMDLPATVAMTGPNYAGVDGYTYGAMFSHQMVVMTAVVVAIMNVLLFVRHTRTEEQSGRAELVRASVVGRHAPTAAATAVLTGANVLLGVLLALTLGGSGIESVTWGGSVLFGAVMAATGLAFLGVTAVTVQISENARSAAGLAFAVLGVAYAVRAISDVGEGTFTWLSPLGWAQQTRPLIDDRWWPLALLLALTVVLLALAVQLSSHRDVGAGLRAPRPGAASASAVLSRPEGLALRLQRGSLLGWGVTLALLGLTYGSVLGEAEDMLGAVEDLLPDITGAGLTEAFLSMIVAVLAMVCAIQAVMAVLRLRSEENAGRAEALLATGLSRTRWAAGHLAASVVGSTVILSLAGAGLGLAGAGATGDGDLVARAVGAALAYAPAVWVTSGIALAFVGWLPRAASAAWAVVVYSFLVIYLGGILRFPAWMHDLSPFGHVPQLPAAELRWTPLFVLTGVAAGAMAFGLAGLRRRDLLSPA
jgi:ABC-2 type transport system permease protein